MFTSSVWKESFHDDDDGKNRGAYVFPKANQVAPLVSALVKQILHSRSFFAFLLQAADTILHLLSYVLKPI